MLLCSEIKEEIQFLKKHYPEKYKQIRTKSVKTAVLNSCIAIIFSILLLLAVIPFFNISKIIGLIFAAMAIILIIVTIFSILILIREKLIDNIRPFNLGFHLREDMIFKNNIEKIREEEDGINLILLSDSIKNKVTAKKRI